MGADRDKPTCCRNDFTLCQCPAALRDSTGHSSRFTCFSFFSLWKVLRSWKLKHLTARHRGVKNELWKILDVIAWSQHAGREDTDTSAQQPWSCPWTWGSVGRIDKHAGSNQEVGAVQSGEEKAPRRRHSSLSVLKGGLSLRRGQAF